jgi:hypothetical protein
MCRSYVLLGLLTACAGTLSVGCAGTQTQEAFTIRPPAPYVPFVATPNVSAEHQQNLEAVLDRSLRDQERDDQRADLLSVAPAQDEHASKDGPRCEPEVNASFSSRSRESLGSGPFASGPLSPASEGF